MDDDAPLVELAVVLFFLVDILGLLLEPNTNGGRQLLWAIAEATEHKQCEGTKAQESKPEYKTKDNQKFFTQQ
jgi:hypothetical protein